MDFIGLVWFYIKNLNFMLFCMKFFTKFKRLINLKISLEVMNNDTDLNVGQEIYKLFSDLRKSCKTVTITGMYGLEEVLRQELSECVLAIWCSGYIGYKHTDYCLVLNSIDKCGYYISMLHDLGKVSSFHYQNWTVAIDSIMQGLKKILEDSAFFSFSDKANRMCF